MTQVNVVILNREELLSVLNTSCVGSGGEELWLEQIEQKTPVLAYATNDQLLEELDKRARLETYDTDTAIRIMTPDAEVEIGKLSILELIKILQTHEEVRTGRKKKVSTVPIPPGLLREVVCKTKKEVEQILKVMTEIVEKFEAVTSADFKNLVGFPTKSVDEFWGWKTTDGAKIEKFPGGWRLVLPEPEKV